MKKTYIIPTLCTVSTTECLPIASSDPQVGLDTNDNVNASDVDVRGSSRNYNVWNEDWSK